MFSSKLKTLEGVVDFCHLETNLQLTVQKRIVCQILGHTAYLPVVVTFAKLLFAKYI